MEYARIQGLRGEQQFRGFMNSNGIPYLWIDQETDTMATSWKSYGGKRPDAVVPSADNDVVLIDVKNRKVYTDRTDSDKRYVTLDEEDAKRLRATEQKMGKPVLLVYKGDNTTENKWYAAYLSEAMKEAVEMKDRNGKIYYMLDLKEFTNFESMVKDGISTEGLQRQLFN